MVHGDWKNRKGQPRCLQGKARLIAAAMPGFHHERGLLPLLGCTWPKPSPTYPIGVIIRNGDEVARQGAQAYLVFAYPPLDNLAPNGDMKVYKANEVTAKEFLKMGARDGAGLWPLFDRPRRADQLLLPDRREHQPALPEWAWWRRVTILPRVGG